MLPVTTKDLKQGFSGNLPNSAALPDSWLQAILALQEDLVAQALQLLKYKHTMHVEGHLLLREVVSDIKKGLGGDVLERWEL